MSTLTSNVKVENFSHAKSDFNKDKGFSRHHIKYNHEQKDGGSYRGAAKFKAKFEISFPRGLYFDKKENDPFPKLMGIAEYDMNDPKVLEFVDTPERGVKDGWVDKDEVEMVDFNQFKAKAGVKKVAIYSNPAKEEKYGTVDKDTVLISDAKQDGCYHVTYGGGKPGSLFMIRKGIAKALFKKKKECRLGEIKSEQALEKAIKFPIWFGKTEDGDLTGKGRQYVKITYRASDGENDGYMCKFDIPGVRELTLEELQSNAITGRPCFTISNLYVGGGKYSLQIYLSSFVVTNVKPIEYQSAQQEDIDEFANNPEFVERMKSLVPEKAPTSPKNKSKPKTGKKSKSKDIKDIIAPTLEPVDIEGGDDDSEDEQIAGVPSNVKDEDEDEDEQPKEKTPEKSAKSTVKKDKKSKKEKTPEKKSKKKAVVESDEEDESTSSTKKKEVVESDDESASSTKEKEESDDDDEDSSDSD